MKLFKPIREFVGFDQVVRRYIAMHWLGGFLLIYATLLPIFMNKLDINLLNAGMIISLAALLDVIFTFILSRSLDKISPNLGMAIDWWTESIPPIIYSLSSTFTHFFIGTFARGITNVLNPIYKVYENEIFPEKKRSLIYTYHLITPELFSLLFYPLIGYLLTYVFPTLKAFRIVFAVCGIGYIGVGFIPLKGLKKVKPTVLPEQKITFQFPRELYLMGLAQVLVIVGLNFTSTLITSYYILDQMNGTIMSIVMLEVFESVVIIITGLFTKDLGKKMADEKLAQFGVAFFGGFSLLMIFGKSYLMIVLAFIFRAIGNTIWYPHHYSALMQYIPREKRGLFFGSMSSLNKLVGIAIPVLAGFLATTIGFYVPFAVTLLSFSAVGIIYQVMFRKRAV